MEVKVIKRYNDIVLKKIQEVGTVFKINDKRAEHLIKEGMVERVSSKSKDGKADKEV